MKNLRISDQDNILVISPHPDDEAIGCGGLLLTYPKQCSVLVVTDGRYGGLKNEPYDVIISERKLESKNAMKYAGIKKLDFLEIEDGRLEKDSEKFTQYDFSSYSKIFCPNNGEQHPDHACILGLLGTLEINTDIFMYEVWNPLSAPSHYLDISNVYKKKIKLIRKYKSQIKQVDYDGKILGLNKYRGIQVYPAIPYAETYQKIN